MKVTFVNEMYFELDFPGFEYDEQTHSWYPTDMDVVYSNNIPPNRYIFIKEPYN